MLGLDNANSTEMDPATPHPVISLLSEQGQVENKGGTMRLGAYNCLLSPHTKAYQAYGKPVISERHRHRFEFNNLYKEACEKEGLVLSGILENDELCEVAEIKGHPWMLGVHTTPSSSPSRAPPTRSSATSSPQL